MNRELVDKIADAILYEGYILYPYRPSVKNRQRWTFGGLYPRAHCADPDGADAWAMQTECLLTAAGPARLNVRVRFLHLVDRRIGQLPVPLAHWPEHEEPALQFVDKLLVGGRLLQAWQEAEEREIESSGLDPAELARMSYSREFAFPALRSVEPLRDGAGLIVGAVVRERQPLEARVDVSIAVEGNGLCRIRVRIVNASPAAASNRDAALLYSLVSTHTILSVEGGEFISLLDPPEAWKAHAAACANVGTWPVLVGEAGARDAVLSSPIILYDYPEIAPESPGALFDSTEIDEILTLRILTMTDDEKLAMAGVDERARALLERTEALGAEHLWGLHGALRNKRPVAGAFP